MSLDILNNLPAASTLPLGAQGGAAVTPSDSTDLGYLCRGIMVTAAGNVKVTSPNGDTPTWPSLQPGVLYPIWATRIWSTGTTATGIVAAK